MDFGPLFEELSVGIPHDFCPKFVQCLSKVCPLVAHHRLLHVVIVPIWSCGRPPSVAARGLSLQ